MKKKLLTFFITCLSICVSLLVLASCTESAVYKVDFKVGETSTSIEVVEGGKVSKPQNPVKNGYDFNGWYVGDTAWSFEDNVVNDNVTLEAKFAPTVYNLTYNLNGGSVATANPTTYNIETETFSINNPTKNHYTFDGWDLGDGINKSSVSIEKGSVGNKTLTAKFTAVKYSITYELNGGITSNPATYTVEDNFTLNTPVKNGSTFVGWTWEGQTQPVLFKVIEVGTFGNLTFTANFEKSYVVNNEGYITAVGASLLNSTLIDIPAVVDGINVVGISQDVLKSMNNVSEFTTSNANFKVIDGNLYSADGSILYRYAPNKNDTSFVIPEGVTQISAYAFANANYLTELVVPSEVVTVGENILDGTNKIIVKVESSAVSANYPNDWAKGAKDVIYDYLTGDDDDNILGGF